MFGICELFGAGVIRLFCELNGEQEAEAEHEEPHGQKGEGQDQAFAGVLVWSGHSFSDGMPAGVEPGGFRIHAKVARGVSGFKVCLGTLRTAVGSGMLHLRSTSTEIVVESF